MAAATFETNLFEHLNALFMGNTTVRDFRDWFSSVSWELDIQLPEALYELASEIEHLGYIRDSGIWDDRAYLQNLRATMDGFGFSDTKSG